MLRRGSGGRNYFKYGSLKFFVFCEVFFDIGYDFQSIFVQLGWFWSKFFWLVIKGEERGRNYDIFEHKYYIKLL